MECSEISACSLHKNKKKSYVFLKVRSRLKIYQMNFQIFLNTLKKCRTRKYLENYHPKLLNCLN